MLSDRKLADEAGRVSALRRYCILDTPPEAPFDCITKLVQTQLGVPIAAISLVDTDRQWLKSRTGVEIMECPREISFCSHTIQGSGPLYIPDAILDQRFAQNPLVIGPPYIRSYLGVPLATPDGYNIGSLCAIDIQPRTFTRDQIQLLSSFGSLVVDELEMSCIAKADGLTGLISRRSFVLAMKRHLARASLSFRPTTLVVFDIDHFKQINDAYGYEIGDAILRNIANRVRSLLREGDILGRLGGEEFGILLSQTDEDAAFEVIERIRRAIEREPILDNPEVSVTASFGISSPRSLDLNPLDWLQQADGALSKAKDEGRNLCYLAHELAGSRSGFRPS